MRGLNKLQFIFLIITTFFCINTASSDPNFNFINVGGNFPQSIANLDVGYAAALPIYEMAIPYPQSPYIYVAIPEKNCPSKHDGVSLVRLSTIDGDSLSTIVNVGNQCEINTKVYHMSLAFTPYQMGYPQYGFLAYVDENQNKKLVVAKQSCTADTINTYSCKWEFMSEDSLKQALGENKNIGNVSLQVDNENNLFVAYQISAMEQNFPKPNIPHQGAIGLIKYNRQEQKWQQLISPNDNFRSGVDKIYLQLINDTPWVAYTEYSEYKETNYTTGNIKIIRQSKNNPSQWEQLPKWDNSFTRDGMDFTQCMGKACLVYARNPTGHIIINQVIWQGNGSGTGSWIETEALNHESYYAYGVMHPSITDGLDKPIISCQIKDNHGIYGPSYIFQFASGDAIDDVTSTNLTTDTIITATVQHWDNGRFQPLTFTSKGNGYYGFYKRLF